jgi:hypothetical protein
MVWGMHCAQWFHVKKTRSENLLYDANVGAECRVWGWHWKTTRYRAFECGYQAADSRAGSIQVG